MKVRDHHLIVFTKNPVEGEVKTRLAKRIDTVKALEIQQIEANECSMLFMTAILKAIKKPSS